MKILRFFTMLVVALVAGSAVAQEGTAVRWGDMGWSSTTRKADATRAAVTYYVATTGSDSNTCTTEAAACLTLQGAIDKIPKNIYHAVTVQLGSGSFAGAFVSNFTVHPVAARSVGLLIQGTLTSATLQTGSATGTATSGSAQSGSTFATLTDTGATWTANDLRGKLLAIPTGTGSSATAFYTIASNTGTVITLAGAWNSATPGSGSTYAIYDYATTINSAPSNALGPDGTSIGTSALLNFVGNSAGGQSTSPVIQVFKLKLSGSGGVVVSRDGTATVLVRSCHLATSGASVSVLAWTRSGFYLHRSYSVCTSTCFHLSPSPDTRNPDGPRVTSTMLHNGAYGFSDTAQYVVVSSSYLLGQTVSALESNVGAMTSSQIINSRVDCNSAGGTGFKSPSGAGVGGNVTFSLGITTTDISNCATAIALRNPYASATLSTVTGTGNTTGISMIEGARMKVNSATTLTGTTELSIDGDTTNDLTDMRAASPKHLKNSNYFTVIYE